MKKIIYSLVVTLLLFIFSSNTWALHHQLCRPGEAWCVQIYITFFTLGFIFWIGLKFFEIRNKYLSYIYPRHKIVRKSCKTMLLLDSLAKNDANMTPNTLLEITRETFLKQRPDSRIYVIDLVNVRYSTVKLQREFTSLITGTKDRKIFQEFWSFELQPDGWRLKTIEQPLKGDYLSRKNLS